MITLAWGDVVGIITALGAIGALVQTVLNGRTQRKTQAIALETKITVDGRMTAMLAMKDELIAVMRAAGIAEGRATELASQREAPVLASPVLKAEGPIELVTTADVHVHPKDAKGVE